MPLHLTDGQLRKIRELQELLIAPLRFPDTASWTAAVHGAATELFGVERSLLVLPGVDGDVRLDAPNLADESLEALGDALTGVAAGANRYGDSLLDRAMRRLAASGIEVWDRRIAERISRIPLEDMPRFYPEVVRPYEFEGMLVMAHSLPEGRAQMHILPAGSESTAFGNDALDVFRLLLPAFRSGSRAHALASRRRRRLRESLALLQEGVAVFRDGARVYRNRSLEGLLSAEERQDDLSDAIEACAENLRKALANRAAPERGLDCSTEVRTPTNRYRLAASHLEGGYGGVPVTVLVVVRPAVPPLPDGPELRERYSLTPRQAEVATLLARGHSNREIAERLTISPHTARHHAQRVLEKTGAPSRKALALKFLEDSG